MRLFVKLKLMLMTLGLLIWFGLGNAPPPVFAASLVVNNLADNTTGGDGQCTLREAINNANSNSDTTAGDCATGQATLDTITFVVSGQIILSGPADEDGNASGDLDILSSAGPLTLDGDERITLNGNENDRLLDLLPGGSDTLILDGLTIQRGRITTAAGGGGVRRSTDGDVIIRNCFISDNTISVLTNDTTFIVGGGVRSSGPLSIQDSTISGNSISVIGDMNRFVDGGGLYSGGGDVTLTGSTISDNSITVMGDSNEFVEGGSLSNGGGSLTFNINSSTISGNVVNVSGNGSRFVGGGGLANGGGGLTFNINNSTISGNSVNVTGNDSEFVGGGGITNGGGSLTFNLNNNTVTGNTVNTSGSNNTSVRGGGIDNGGGSNTFNFNNNIVTGNSATTDPDIGDTSGIVSNGRNVIGVDSMGADFATAGDDVGTPPANVINLILAQNGGSTRTHLLVLGSPALDQGDLVVCFGSAINGVDQRGAPRDGAACDIGAVEGIRFFGTVRLYLPVVIKM